MMRIAVAGLALLAALATGCAPRPAAAVAAAPADPTDVAGAVKGTIEQWRQAYEVRSMDALAKLYAHDPGLAIVQEGTLQLGWPAIEVALRARLARATAIHVRIKDLQVTALGPGGAAAIATMMREVADGATTATENGVLTLVLRKDDAGWAIVAEHYSYKRP